MSTGARPGSRLLPSFGPLIARPPHPGRPQKTAIRALRVVMIWAGVFLVLLLGLFASALIAINLPVGRHFVVREVNSRLAPTFQGKIRIEAVGTLSPFGLSGGDVTVEDAAGHRVLDVHGVKLQVSTWSFLKSILFERRSPITLILKDISIDRAEARIDEDKAGRLPLVDAFSPRPSLEPAPPDNPNARAFELIVSRIRIRNARARGQVGGVRPLDIDIRDLAGALHYTPEAFVADVFGAIVVAHQIANGADVSGSLRAHVDVPLSPSAAPEGDVTWVGSAGMLAHSVRAKLAKGKLDAVVDIPAITPENVRTLWPASAINESGRVHVEAHGLLPKVGVSVEAALGGSTAITRGQLDFDSRKEARLTIDLRNIDIHQFAASAPLSRVDLKGEVIAAEDAAGALVGDATILLTRGILAGQSLPPARAVAHAEGAGAHIREATANITVSEPSAPTAIALRYVADAPYGESAMLGFTLESNVQDLDRVSELHHSVRGAARVAAKGAFYVNTMTLGATLTVAARSLAGGGTRVENASIQAEASGPLARLAVRGSIDARKIVAFGRNVAWLRASGAFAGPVGHGSVALRGGDTPDVDGTFEANLEGGGFLVRGLRLGLSRAGERAVVSADEVSVRGESVHIDRARIEGVGAIADVSLSKSAEAFRLRASSRGIDVGRIGRLLHTEDRLKGGTFAFDVTLDASPWAVSGTVEADLARAFVGKASNASAHVNLNLEGRRAAGYARAQLPGIGSIDVEAPGLTAVGRQRLDASSWTTISGAVDVDGRVDLAKLGAALPADVVPWSVAGGQVSIDGRVARANATDAMPGLHVSVVTDHLLFAPKTTKTRDIDGVLIIGPAPWRLEGVDVDARIDIDGNSGILGVSSRFHDVKGELGQLQITIPHSPYRDLLQHVDLLATDWRSMPFDAHLSVADRGIDAWPPLLKQAYVSGRFHADLWARGTPDDPTVDLVAGLHDSLVTGDDSSLPPVDINVSVHYDGRHGRVLANAQSGGHTAAEAEAQIDGRMAAFFESAQPEWDASARVHFDSFPLESIPALDDKSISGILSGDVTIDGLHQDARANLDVVVQPLRMGVAQFKSARIVAKIDDHGSDASLRVDQDDGFVDTKVHAMTTWMAALTPTLDPARPLQMGLTSKNFRLGGLLPFVDAVVDELDGRMDADAQAELDPVTRAARLSGTVAISHGVVEAAAGGGEFHDVSARVRFTPDGAITLEKLTASGLTGQVQATGAARMRGLQIESAKATVIIPSDSPIPVSAAGADIGNVDGRLEITETAAQDGKPTALKVDVPHVRIALPEGASPNAESLGAMPNVHIGAHRGNPTEFVVVPIDPQQREAEAGRSGSGTTVDLTLDDAQIIRGRDVNVPLSGHLVANVGSATKVSGQLVVKGGASLSVQGKKFEIDQGTVTLTGDPTNPEVVVTASWKAPDGTKVVANFVGPLKAGKVTLSSEPPLSRQEIVELLVFGTPDGPQAQQSSSDPTTSALAAAGGQAAQPLNHALSQLGLGAVTAKVGSRSSNPTPEVEIQVARDISVELAIILGQPPPGVNPDTTLLTVDWRFLARWSLASTVGDAGTTIFDLLWQKRY